MVKITNRRNRLFRERSLGGLRKILAVLGMNSEARSANKFTPLRFGTHFTLHFIYRSFGLAIGYTYWALGV
jgi:hypothetical protein